MGLFNSGIRGDIRDAYSESKGIWFYEETRVLDNNVLIKKRISPTVFETLEEVKEYVGDNNHAFYRSKMKIINRHCIKMILKGHTIHNHLPTIQTMYYFTEEYGKKKGWLV
jgi:hypothetical protein